MYANTPSRPSVVQSITLLNVYVALESPKGVNKYSNKPNGVIIAVFVESYLVNLLSGLPCKKA
jgi:hypothetical protein